MQYLAYPHYQKTNIDWLGDIPQHWGYRKLRYYSKRVATGTTPTGDIYFEDATENWFTPSDFDDRKLELNNSNRKINITAIENGEVKVFPAGSVLVIGIGATLGKIGMSKTDFSCNQQINIIIPDDILDARFLAYSLQVKIEVMKIISNSTTIGIMNQDKTKLIDICAPHLEEQKKIAFFLDYKTRQIDQLIEKKKELIEKLEEQRIAVITQAVTKGIDKNAKLKPSGVDWLTDVPEHWETTKIKYNCKIYGRIGFRGYSTEDIVTKEEGAITLSPSNMRDGVLRFNSNTYLSWDKYYESPEIMIFKGDVLMVKTGSTYGKISYVQEQPDPMTINPQLVVFKDIQVTGKFFSYYLLSKPLQGFFKILNTGSTIPTMTQDSIGKLIYLFPPKEEQRAIEKHIEKSNKYIDAMMVKTEKTIENLKEYRSAIIHSAVTGKIDVREIEVPEVIS